MKNTNKLVWALAFTLMGASTLSACSTQSADRSNISSAAIESALHGDSQTQVASENVSQEDIKNYVKDYALDIVGADQWDFRENEDGTMTEDTESLFIDTLNLYRYTAGAPLADLDTSCRENARLVCESYDISGFTAHNLTARPKDITDEQWESAKETAHKSNCGEASADRQNIWNQIAAYICDSYETTHISTNEKCVGHRRAFLGPRLTATNIYGKNYYNALGQLIGGYDACPLTKRTSLTDNEPIIAWPAVNTPTEMFPETSPWSIQFGYNLDENADIRVTITRESDGKTWTNEDFDTFYIDNKNYSDNSALIFSFAENDLVKVGETYDVTVTGLPEGDLNYSVNFFELGNLNTPVIGEDDPATIEDSAYLVEQ